MKKKKILYIQHASFFGGSAMSLLYTIEGLDSTKYEPIIALASRSEELVSFYSSRGLEVVDAPGISLLNHSTVAPRPLTKPSSWLELVKTTLAYNETRRNTVKLVERVKPDIVHLNAMPLSLSALALKEYGIPFFWHVREPPAHELIAWRTRLIRRIMVHCGDSLIFICKADRQLWVGGEVGDVIYNFVDLDRFSPSIKGDSVRKEHGIEPDDPVLLYVGGPTRVKGILVMLGAVAKVRRQVPRVKLLMPGFSSKVTLPWKTRLARKLLPLIGFGTVFQRAEKMVEGGLRGTCIAAPFQTEIPQWIAASDMVIFPSTKEHFARPAIEASAMGKPVIASDFPVMHELLDEGRTGMLVEPGNETALADSIITLCRNTDLAHSLGQAGLNYARTKFSARRNCEQIMQKYEQVS